MMKQWRHVLKLILLKENIFPVRLLILNPESLNIKDQQTICICCLPVLTVIFRSLASVLLYLTNKERNKWLLLTLIGLNSRTDEGFIPWEKENSYSRFVFLNRWLAKKMQGSKNMAHRKKNGCLKERISGTGRGSSWRWWRPTCDAEPLSPL